MGSPTCSVTHQCYFRAVLSLTCGNVVNLDFNVNQSSFHTVRH